MLALLSFGSTRGQAPCLTRERSYQTYTSYLFQGIQKPGQVGSRVKKLDPVPIVELTLYLGRNILFFFFQIIITIT